MFIYALLCTYMLLYICLLIICASTLRSIKVVVHIYFKYMYGCVFLFVHMCFRMYHRVYVWRKRWMNRLICVAAIAMTPPRVEPNLSATMQLWLNADTRFRKQADTQEWQDIYPIYPSYYFASVITVVFLDI